MGKIVSGVGSLLGIGGGGDAGEDASNAIRQGSLEAAQAAAFRPVGMTSRFGTSNFGFTDIGGVPRVTSAGYEVSPELRALQDALMQLTGGGVGYAQDAMGAAAPLGQAAQGLFGLGSQYLAMSPEQARQQYMQEQYAMLDPIRAREEQRLGSSVFGRGRAGLSIGDMGQPELFALASARRGQDLQLAAQAEQAAQQRAQFGAGLFGTGAGLLGQQYAIPTQALGPLQSLLGTVGSIEELGQQPFQLGLQVGSAGQPGASMAGQLLGAGSTAAANAMMQGQMADQQARAGLFGGLISAGGSYLAASKLAPALLAASDRSVKNKIKVIGKMTNGLNVYSFEYKPEHKDKYGHGSFVGVMADEVEKVIPAAVLTNNYGHKIVNYSLI
jgi:hypothetical protein